jgi:ubiquitin-conjugating enzyme E2 S
MIVPNPESSLNEDASRLMLENYEDYFKHAKLWTSIHAPKGAPAAALAADATAEAASPAKTQDKEKEKVEKKKVEQKKKSLKRL